MKKEVLDNFAISFIRNHFDEIDLKKVDWKICSKEQAIEEIQNLSYITSWVICEVMDWGTPINYLKDYIVEFDGDERLIIKIEDDYFTPDGKGGLSLTYLGEKFLSLLKQQLEKGYITEEQILTLLPSVSHRILEMEAMGKEATELIAHLKDCYGFNEVEEQAQERIMGVFDYEGKF